MTTAPPRDRRPGTSRDRRTAWHGSQPRYDAAGPGAAVLRLQRSAGNRAVGAVLARIARNPQAEIEAAERELQGAKEVGEDLLQELGHATRVPRGAGARRARRTVGQVEAVLREVAREGGPRAADAERLADQIASARKKVGDLKRSAGITGAKPKEDFSAGKGERATGKTEQAGAKAKEATAKAEKSAERATVKGEAAGAKGTLKTEAAATQAIVKAEETAIKAEAKLGTRVAAGAGRLGLALLLPGPEDAIIMMAQFAGSYEEAWEAIEQRNTRDGIAFGIAAGMMGLDWDWVKENLWRRFPVRDVETEVLGAVGKAERAFNDGLQRGHKYGAGHPLGMKSRILAEAFAALASAGYETDEEGLFKIDTVARVARVLMPLADDFLSQAAARREARQRREAEAAAKQLRDSGCVGFKC